MKLAWDLFDQRMEDRSAAAFRMVALLRSMAQTEAEALLRTRLLGMDDAMLRFLDNALQLAWLQLKLDGYDENSSERSYLQAYQQIVQEELARREMVNPSAKPLSNEKLTTYSELVDRFDRLQRAMRPDHALNNFVAFENLITQLDAALQFAPQGYLHEDLQQLYVDSLGYMGDCKAALHDQQSTQAYYEAAILRAKNSQLDQLANKYRLKLADYFFSQTKAFLQGLQSLLPEWLELQSMPPSLARVELSAQLATAYLKLEDYVEASQIREQILDDLPSLGFVIPSGTDLNSTLASWIQNAFALEREQSSFQACLQSVCKAYITVASLDSRLAIGVQAQEQALAQMNALMNLRLQIDARIQTIEKRDQAYLASLSLDNQEVGEDEFAAFQKKWEDYIQRFNAVIDRSYEGEAGPEIFADAKQLEMEARELGNKQFAGMMLNQQAEVFTNNEQWELIPPLLNLAIEEALDEQRIDDALFFYKGLINSYLAIQDFAKADEHCDEAIQLVESHRYHLGSTYQQNAYMEDKIWCYQLGAFIAWKIDDIDSLLQRIALAKASASMRQFLTAKSRGTTSQIAALEAQIVVLDQQIKDAPPKSKLILQNQRRKLYELIEIQQSISEALPIPTQAVIQKQLGSDEVICDYFWLAQNVLLIIGISSERLEVVRHIFAEEELKELNLLLAQIGGLENLQAINVNRLNALGQLLLPKPIQTIMDDHKRLIISPHQDLHLFPFHAIQYDAKYLFARFAISYIPNMTALLVSLPANTKQETLAMGVANFQVADMKLATLAGALGEVQALERIYADSDANINIRLNEEVRLAQIRALASQNQLMSYRTIHLALHGENASHRPNNPMETRLFLQDGAIDGLEISQWQLKADLVILSACHSGRRGIRGRTSEEGRAADEIFGLPAAFFEAGARQILGVLWPASDIATQMIMLAFHEHLQTMEPDFALQAAMNQYLQKDHQSVRPGMTRNLFVEDQLSEQEEVNQTNPVYWAPFFLTRVHNTWQAD